MTNLSPAAQAVMDAYENTRRSVLCGGRVENLVAAVLRAVANEVVPETPPLFEPWETAVDWELFKKDQRRNESIRVHQCLMGIADELEGVTYGTYRSDLENKPQ